MRELKVMWLYSLATEKFGIPINGGWRRVVTMIIRMETCSFLPPWDTATIESIFFPSTISTTIRFSIVVTFSNIYWAEETVIGQMTTTRHWKWIIKTYSRDLADMDCHGWFSWMTFIDDFHGWLSYMTFMDDFHEWLSWMMFDLKGHSALVY